MQSFRSRLPIPGVVAVTLALVACGTNAVEWRDPRTVVYDASLSRLTIDSVGAVGTVAREPAPDTRPDDPMACTESLRVAVHTLRPAWHPGAERTLVYAVWWSLRADSSAALRAAVSRDSGRTWAAPVPVDSADRSRRGCDRPPPDLAADGEYVHVSYALEAPEGTGVFYAHSMDEGALFHWPTTVAYGDRLTRSAVAAAGDRVVVAYEDPAGAQRIGLVLSGTQGHIFERRLHSVSTGRAVRPGAAVANEWVAITWAAADRAADSARTLRIGRIR